MPQDSKREMVENWAAQLGLAPASLLDAGRDPSAQHIALLDGVEGSLAVSTEVVDASVGLDWTWSSRLGSHVQFEADKLLVRQLDQRTPHLRFEVEQVNANVERFFEFVIGQQVAPAATIVDHLVACFRSHRMAAASHGLTDEESLTTFLSLIDREIVRSVEPLQLHDQLPPDHTERLRGELRYSRITGRKADLSLMMRHAAGMVFQETHAELTIEPIQSQLFGLPLVAARSTRNRIGAYYTPPGLARTLSEVAITPHLSQPAIRILDPACGSGIFLIEAVRCLERNGYKGAVELLGYDVSPIAVELAEFALRHSGLTSNVSHSVRVADFITLPPEANADVVLMNPPFVSYQDMGPEVQDVVRSYLGERYRFRPDFSMVFIGKALDNLKEGGTLASLLPSGVLAQRSSYSWRLEIAQANDIELIAVLGDHGLFRDATVNVAAVSLRKTQPAPSSQLTLLWASQKKGASEAALRRLRRWANGDQRNEAKSDWAIYASSDDTVVSRDDWTPRPNTLGDLPARLRRLPQMSRVDRLFHVEQGIRPGHIGDKLIIDTATLQQLPAKERKYFRPVAENRSIKRGRIHPAAFMFFPPRPMTAEQVKREVPEFYQRQIEALKLPADQPVEAIRPRRGTHDRRLPRLVSRVYVGPESFALDETGEYVVVQGNSWLSRWNGPEGGSSDLALLRDYCFIFNSRLFFMLLREHGRIVGGGQVEASKAATGPVPLPDLRLVYSVLPYVKALADELRKLDDVESPPLSRLDEFAAAAYQTQLEEWSISG